MNVTKKCLVWDLDETLWNGVCLEGNVRLRPEAVCAVEELDRRGILQSIASRGDEETAMSVLLGAHLLDFFLVPQINWLPKSQNILKISKELDVSLDSMAFVDDERFEREQIQYMLPEILVIESEKAGEIPTLPCFLPAEVTSEARSRRQLYKAELERKRLEGTFRSREDFLASCAMELTIRRMDEADVSRVLELMTRTHQLNTTGLVLTRDDVRDILSGDWNRSSILVMELYDKFGGYGIIGAALIESGTECWRLKYLALSCRVMGRGIERAFLASMARTALLSRVHTLEAEFRSTGRNRMMRALYQMMGFRKVAHLEHDGLMIFRALADQVPDVPRWVSVR